MTLVPLAHGVGMIFFLLHAIIVGISILNVAIILAVSSIYLERKGESNTNLLGMGWGRLFGIFGLNVVLSSVGTALLLDFTLGLDGLGFDAIQWGTRARPWSVVYVLWIMIGSPAVATLPIAYVPKQWNFDIEEAERFVLALGILSIPLLWASLFQFMEPIRGIAFAWIFTVSTLLIGFVANSPANLLLLISPPAVAYGGGAAFWSSLVLILALLDVALQSPRE